MDGKILVVSYDEMLERFVPKPTDEDEPEAELSTLNFQPDGKPSVEAEMYGPLVEAFNDTWLLPGLVARATPHKGDTNVASKEKIDGGLYPIGDAPSGADYTNWSTIELSIECKMESVQDDPFDDTRTNNFQPMALRGRRVLGQIMSYSVLVFDNQQRTHHFTLVIFGDMARIVRWDRSGAVVSEKFNYVQEPLKLARFLWRFSRLSAAQRGHDSSATRLASGTPNHDLILRRRLVPYKVEGHILGKHAYDEFMRSTTDERSFWKLEVHDSKKTRAFLVGKPHFIADGLAGRGTKGYVAIDLDDSDGPFVYLKDAWRVAHPRMRQEGEVLAYLADPTVGSPVKNVPTLVCHGDVPLQVTDTQRVWKDKHPDAEADECPLKTHHHYRMVVKEVGLPISTFCSGVELVFMIVNCIIAHRDAYRKGVIHRDISSGNILIYPREVVGPDGKLKTTREPLLSDWELSKFLDDADAGPRQPGRTGTWQFLSANALRDLSKPIIVEDEMESFFHLILYLAIRYLPHNCSAVGPFMEKYFDGFNEVAATQEYSCGDAKLTAMKLGVIKPDAMSERLQFFAAPCPPPSQAVDSSSGVVPGDQASNDKRERHPIEGLMYEFLLWISGYYCLRRDEELRSKYGAGNSAAPAERASSRTMPAIQEESTAQIFAWLGDWEAPAQPTESTHDREVLLPEQRRIYERYAANLADHDEVINLFKRHLRTPTPGTSWYIVDKQEDQLPPGYRPGDERAVGVKRSMVDSYAAAAPGGAGGKRGRPGSITSGPPRKRSGR
ncbi:hypothetical protein C8Q79DRAFT_757799 [Trametes meyenii]|nr:hypothetical protein C8Q79DRAFT_757799 [Trametes meyenii]